MIHFYFCKIGQNLDLFMGKQVHVCTGVAQHEQPFQVIIDKCQGKNLNLI